MKTFLLITYLTLGLWSPADILAKLSWHQKKEYVYVCNSSTSVAYHAFKYCRGLNRCAHIVIKTTLDSAKTYYDKRSCKICE